MPVLLSTVEERIFAALKAQNDSLTVSHAGGTLTDYDFEILAKACISVLVSDKLKGDPSLGHAPTATGYIYTPDGQRSILIHGNRAKDFDGRRLDEIRIIKTLKTYSDARDLSDMAEVFEGCLKR